MKSVFLVLAVILSGCGGPVALQSQTPPLFSVWTESPTQNSMLDLTNGKIGTFAISLVFQNGAECNGNATVGGDGTTGTALVTGMPVAGNCQLVYGGNYTYSITGDTLTLCKGATCTEYTK